MTVSLCLMVRNEEEKLAACLQSAADLVDEIIVVDTGSSDGTRELAAKLGARVFEFPWCDDFAAGRNECIRHAWGDFIFWMDADERIDKVNREKLKALFETLPRVSPPPQPSPIKGEGARDDLTPTGSDYSPLTSRPAGVPVPQLTTHYSPLTNVAYVMKCLSVQAGESVERPPPHPGPLPLGARERLWGTVVDHVRVFRNRPDVRWKSRSLFSVLEQRHARNRRLVGWPDCLRHA